MRRLGITLPLAFMGLLLATSATAIPVARLQLWSDPGDWVGGGQTVDKVYDTSIGDVVSTGVQTINSPGAPNGVSISLLDSLSYTTLWFRTRQLGVPLAAHRYLDAQRAPFEDPGHPGLDVSYQGRGENDLTGEFTLYEITFSASLDRVLSLVVEFEQHGQGREAALRGRLEYNSTGLTLIPEPSTALLMLLGFAGLSERPRMARRAD